MAIWTYANWTCDDTFPTIFPPQFSALQFGDFVRFTLPCNSISLISEGLHFVLFSLPLFLIESSQLNDIVYFIRRSICQSLYFLLLLFLFFFCFCLDTLSHQFCTRHSKRSSFSDILWLFNCLFFFPLSRFVFEWNVVFHFYGWLTW